MNHQTAKEERTIVIEGWALGEVERHRPGQLSDLRLQGERRYTRQCRTAVDAGVNFIDTANAYNMAEERAGRLSPITPQLLRARHQGVGADGPGPATGPSRKHIMEQCHASLRRLRTDYIDLYQCHRPDPETPLEETVTTMEDLVRQGKVLYWGVSEWSAAQIAAANGIARQLGCRPITSNQPRYNLFWRHPEMELFPYCEQEGIGQVLFSPLAHRHPHRQIRSRSAAAGRHPRRRPGPERGDEQALLDR